MLPVLSQSEADLTACYVQDIGALLQSFSEKDPSCKQSLQQMLASDPAAFSRASIRVLAGSAVEAGARYVVHLLRKHNLLPEALVDPRVKREDAVGAARVIPRISAPLDVDLEKMLGATLALPNAAAQVPRVMRLLDVLEAASPQPRFYLFQSELMGYPDQEVRLRGTLLIARSGKNSGLVARMLLDSDVRVQANAVEALWTFDPEEARPLLTNALRSKTPQVAANAAVGLHRICDLSSLGLLFGMAEHKDVARRGAAAWAMGETGDPRFLPFLTAWYSRSAAGERVNILQALGRIRRREKLLSESGSLDLTVWDREVDGMIRRLVLTIHAADKSDLTCLKPTDFALWEGGALVHDYQISAQPNPATSISGFVLPRFISLDDPYFVATKEAIERCLSARRADDPWRLDRYLPEARTGEGGKPSEKTSLPYEESLLGPFAKAHQRGFFTELEALRMIVDNPGPRERAADDAVTAFDRQSEAMIKFSGKRTLYLFLTPNGLGHPERHIARLTSFVAHEKISLHVFAPEGMSGCEEFQALCKVSEGGSFVMLPANKLADEVDRIYAQSLNRFEVTYQLPEGIAPASGALQITSASGCGRVEFSFV